MNGSARWKMEPLKEIWVRVKVDSLDQYEYVYVLENGEEYRDMLGPLISDSCIDKPIFKC